MAKAKKHGADTVAAAIVASLTPDLVLPEFRFLQEKSPLGGHCYAATEAMYYMLGGRDSGYMPASVMHEGTKHYFLKKRQEKDGKAPPIDLTAGQFKTPVPYEKGRGSCYRQTKPGKRAAVLIERAEALLAKAA
ncbi:MAG: hypothetical protein K2X93_00575 [Candidatus Obscuribacterales bacterium]|nr:hypothetical protein [Candidatus Obscuribacterales bacterium]